VEFDVGLFAGILPVFGHFGAGNFPHPNNQPINHQSPLGVQYCIQQLHRFRSIISLPTPNHSSLSVCSLAVVE